MKFKELRKGAKMTLAEVAAKIGVTDSAVAQWESGATAPTADKLVKLARMYSCTVDELLGAEEER